MKHKNPKKDFNMIVVGTGGQGQITLLQIVARAALEEGYDVKTSELHGLSQRGGSVEVHLRFGRKIYSPLIPQGEADLILGLEMQECLNAVHFSNSKTTFLINKYIVPISLQKAIPEEEILKNLKKITKNIILISAAEICQKEFGTNVVSGIYLLSFASFKNLIPLKSNSIIKAVKKIVPKKYFELNQKTFELAKKGEKSTN